MCGGVRGGLGEGGRTAVVKFVNLEPFSAWLVTVDGREPGKPKDKVRDEMVKWRS